MSKDPKPAEPKRTDPAEALASLTSMLDGLGGLNGLMGKMAETEARSKLINIKLTLLLEHAEIDWLNDPRIQKLSKKP